jgi:hypothetical protein
MGYACGAGTASNFLPEQNILLSKKGQKDKQ